MYHYLADVLFFCVEKSSTLDYRNFLPRVQKIIENHGELRLLIYYSNYQGWEEGAIASDMSATAEFADKLVRFALVNPPEKEVFQKKIKAPLYAGPVKIFEENELGQALDWVRESQD